MQRWSSGAQSGAGVTDVTIHPGPFSIHQDRCIEILKVRIRSVSCKKAIYKDENYFANVSLFGLICCRVSHFEMCFFPPPLAVFYTHKKRVCSVKSNSLRPHGLQPARLLCPWNFPGRNTGVCCHFIQRKVASKVKVPPGKYVSVSFIYEVCLTTII